MKRFKPSIVLFILYGIFIGSIALSAPGLPERVASHFDGSGRPNGWMGGSAYLRFMLLFGTALPLVLIGVNYVIRFFPAGMVNLPHKEYWLAPERRDETYAYFFRRSLWSACMALCFVTGIHWLVVLANRKTPPLLSTPLLLGITGLFIAGLLLWSVGLICHFRKP